MWNTLKNYQRYLQNNPEKYWFKRKLYGWGWTPVSWQGWGTVLGYVLLVILLSLKLSETTLVFFIALFALTGLLLIISYTKGEKPRWQWGESDKKDK